MFKRTFALLAAVVFSAININHAFAEGIDVTYKTNMGIPVALESNDSEVRALMTRAFGAHGAYVVNPASSTRVQFSKTSETSITITYVVGSASQTQTVTGSDIRDATLRACDAAVVYTGKRLSLRPMFSGQLAFVSDRTGKKEIYVSDLFLSNVRPVTNLKSISITPHWTPDGSEVLFTTYFNNNFTDIYAANVSTGKLRGVVVGVRGTSTGAVAAPNGQVAFSSSSSGNTDIYVANSSGKGARAVVRTDDVDSDPSWSPDGSKLVFVSGASGGPQLYTASASGSGMTKIRTGYNYSTEPAWNPVDQNKIAFTYQSGGLRVGVVDMNTKQSKPATQNGNYSHATWCADGRHIVATEVAGASSKLVIIDTETGKVTPISGTQTGNCSEPDYRAR